MSTHIVSYPSIEPDGTLVANHPRRYHPDGHKDVWWEGPDGSYGLGGRRVAALPLFGAHLLPTWSPNEPLYFTEGEPPCAALWRVGLHAVGSVTGASGCPDTTVLSVLIGWDVRCWPDADDAGERHMTKIARRLSGIARSIYFVRWADAPPGGDAADFLVDHGAADVLALPLVTPPEPEPAPTARRYPPPSARYPSSSRSTYIERFKAEHPVSTVLISEFGVLKAFPGRTVRCPGASHKDADRSPSLSIARDDRRAWCHLPGCSFEAGGRGVDAYEVLLIAKGRRP